MTDRRRQRPLVVLVVIILITSFSHIQYSNLLFVSGTILVKLGVARAVTTRGHEITLLVRTGLAYVCHIHAGDAKWKRFKRKWRKRPCSRACPRADVSNLCFDGSTRRLREGPIVHLVHNLYNAYSSTISASASTITLLTF